MPYDPDLADRITRFLNSKSISFESKPMFGGLCFRVENKMCVGISGDRLRARLDPSIEEESLKKPGCEPMDFTGRRMQGFVFIDSIGTRTPTQLTHWLTLALDFNPRAKPSKKRSPQKSPQR